MVVVVVEMTVLLVRPPLMWFFEGEIELQRNCERETETLDVVRMEVERKWFKILRQKKEDSPPFSCHPSRGGK